MYALQHRMGPLATSAEARELLLICEERGIDPNAYEHNGAWFELWAEAVARAKRSATSRIIAA